MNNILIYGAYGYTGKLIVEQAVAKGWKPTVAGRNAELVRTLAKKYQLPSECYSFDDQKAWDRVLTGKELLINCAGPFSLTIHEILPACIRNKTHYVDITGEIKVFEYVLQHDKQAKEAGMVMMPGTGFDVVPTDCLAKFLYEGLPGATSLEMAFDSMSGLSRGTALSVLNRFDQGSEYRENGVIHSEPMGSVARVIHFGGKARHCVRIAWGDVFTAFHTTGIPNIQVFTGMSEKMKKTMRRAANWAWLIGTAFVQGIGRKLIRKKIVGPAKDKRDQLRTFLWGRVTDDQGNEFVVEMETPESYSLTAITVLMCAEKILNGEARTGFNTPAGAFGSDFIMKVESVKRKTII